MIAVALYAINFVGFWYFVVKQRIFVVLNLAVLGPVGNWLTKNWFLIKIGLE